ncbi:MAG: hypothetical protein E7181_00885 [Erysipelotrichaceae bacterium]|nr:hypothetical protein [Erysipelotrichaceae bacterium]
MVKIIIGVIVVAVIAITAFMVLDPNINLVRTTDTSNTTSMDIMNEASNSLSTPQFVVSIEGEISKEGSYGFAEQPTMADLIEAAGGITTAADERCYFEDAKLDNGKTYFISSRYESGNICSLVELKKVNINTDNADTLLGISGFTTSVANSIVSYRGEKGQFNTIEELLEVYGIGNATYRKVRSYVILHE